MRVLGLGGSDHDIAASIVEDGKIRVAIEDERVSRFKYAIGSNLLLGKSRKYCYNALGIKSTDIDRVVIDDILVETAYFGIKEYEKINHHLAHASSCYYPSPFIESAILVVDNAGSLVKNEKKEGIQTISYGIGENKSINLFNSILGSNWDTSALKINGKAYQLGDCDDSLGHFYKIVSGCIGFKFHDNGTFFFPEAGKTMGLAPYGDDRYYNEINQFIKYCDNGYIAMSLCDGKLKNTIAEILKNDSPKDEFMCRASVAWAAQKIIEEALLFCGEYLYRETKSKNLCLAGGVALNCVANGILKQKLPFENIYLFPACGDNGTAIGCAYYGYYKDYAGDKICSEIVSPYFGKDYTDDEINSALDKSDLIVLKTSDYLMTAAKYIGQGKIIGWYQGGSEFGPRALGHRSILGDPRNANMKDILNYRVKFREGFRPFAPSVLHEDMSEFFTYDTESPYMLMAFDIKEDKRDLVPGVVHVDGTARVQTVTKEANGVYYDLIKEFKKQTGIPILINTSFNIKGEPIAETPEDAVACFLKTGIDILVIGKNIVFKKKGDFIMKREEILEKLKEILVQVCELDMEASRVDFENSNFAEECGINSISALEFLLEVEQEFDIEIDDDDLDESLIADINVLVDYIIAKRSGK